jgi:hypothetical protein
VASLRLPLGMLIAVTVAEETPAGRLLKTDAPSVVDPEVLVLVESELCN